MWHFNYGVSLYSSKINENDRACQLYIYIYIQILSCDVSHSLFCNFFFNFSNLFLKLIFQSLKLNVYTKNFRKQNRATNITRAQFERYWNNLKNMCSVQSAEQWSILPIQSIFIRMCRCRGVKFKIFHLTSANQTSWCWKDAKHGYIKVFM